MDAHELFREGRILSREQAEALERKLESCPDDLASRCLLLGYYFIDANKRSVRLRRQKHVLWVIANHPQSEFVGLPECHLYPVSDDNVYGEAKDLWLRNVSEEPDNICILKNAAEFFKWQDDEITVDLYKKAQAIEPDNPEWSHRSGHVYRCLAIRSESPEHYRGALEQYERALGQAADEEEQFCVLQYVAFAAVDAGEMDKAIGYAERLLQMAPKYQEHWNYGNAIHDANTVLGRVAVANRDVEKAKGYLIAAGQRPESPRILPFQFHKSLAIELLRLREKEIVIEYLRLCSRFCVIDDKLPKWEKQIRRGKIPDFLDM